EPAALVVAGFDNPNPRRAEILDARAQLGRQALVLERQRRRAADCAHEIAVLTPRLVVHDHREPPALVLDRGRDASRAGLEELEPAPVRVVVALALGQPVSELERAV